MSALKPWKIIFLIFLVVATVMIIANEPPYRNNRGYIFGTYYNITYKSKEDLQKQIEETLRKVDHSLSPFNKNSIITAINENRDVELDTLFLDVYTLAHDIAEKTDGAFDITVAPLVNAWGFGFKKGMQADSLTIDSLRQYVGYKTLSIHNNRLIKQHQQTMLDCSAIAKGYGCDCVAEMLQSKGVEHFMVEIGGEVVTKGKNDKARHWSIGINKPAEDASGTNNELQEILNISGRSIATSGNYRNYRYENGQKLAHTIDPRTGIPVQHSLLSATVIADDCATADAFATAFMVTGLETALELCNKNNIDAYFIYSDADGNMHTTHTPGMERYIGRQAQ